MLLSSFFNEKRPADLSTIVNKSLMVIFDELYNEKSESFVNIIRRDPISVMEEFSNYYPELERWRLFVDGDHYANSPPKYFWPIQNGHVSNEAAAKLKLYDNRVSIKFKPTSKGWIKYHKTEPGSIEACLNALSYAFDFINKPRDDIEFTKEIHRRLVRNVRKLPYYLVPGEFKKGIAMSFCLTINGAYTLPGLKDLFEKIRNGSLEEACIQIEKLSQILLDKIDKNNSKKFIKYKKILECIASSNKNNNIHQNDGYILNTDSLSEIKENYPEFYNEFLNDLSLLIMNRDCTARYFSVGAGTTHKIDALYKITIPKNTLVTDSRIIKLNFSILSSKELEFLIDALPVSLIKELEKLVTSYLFDKNAEDAPDILNQPKLLKTIIEFISRLELGIDYIDKNDPKKPKGFMPLKGSDLNEDQKLIMAQQLLKQLIMHIACIFSQDRIEEIVKEVWQNYHRNINRDGISDDERLKIIGETIQWFERIHPFGDANGRTFANIILSVLLIENGFPPATFFQPNLFDAFDDIVSVIKRGIANTLEIYSDYKNHNKTNFFGIETSELEEKIQKKIDKLKSELDTAHEDRNQLLAKIANKEQTLMTKITEKANALTENDNLAKFHFSFFRKPLYPIERHSRYESAIIKTATRLLNKHYPESDAKEDEEIFAYRESVLKELKNMQGRSLAKSDVEGLENLIAGLGGSLPNIQKDETLDETSFYKNNCR